jgi:6-phosphogluconolactonase
MFAYVGSRTTKERNARGQGISVLDFDAQKGHFTPVQLLSDLVNPSYLFLHPRLNVLYTVHGDQKEVSSYCIDQVTGHLSFQSQQSCQGKNPVHLALDPSGRFLIVSNHISSSLAILPLAADGSIEAVSQLIQLEGTPGPHRIEQPFSKPHFNPFDPSGRFVLVPDKGLDQVFVFRFEDGQLVPADPPALICREGAGPRHLAFHPSKPWAYVINELDSTVLACRFDAQTGQLHPFQIISTLADSFVGNSRAAAIVASACGQWLFASNRGEDSIAAFRIDTASGRLTLMQTMSCQGKTPRFITTDPTGKWLLVLNEDSDTILPFPISPDAEQPLGEPSIRYETGSPVCLVFA